MSQLVTDQNIAFTVAIISLFLAPNYATLLGLFYLGAATIYLVAHESKALPQLSFILGKKDDIILSIFIGIVATLFWLIGSSFIVIGSIPTTLFSATQVFNLYSNVEVTQPLVTAQGINLFIYGLHIPLVETLFFFGAFLPWVMINIFKLPLRWNSFNINVWWAVALVGVSFALFHITAHQLSDQALLVDMLFGVVSGIVVLQYRYMLPIFIMHVLINSGILLSRGIV